MTKNPTIQYLGRLDLNIMFKSMFGGILREVKSAKCTYTKHYLHSYLDNTTISPS